MPAADYYMPWYTFSHLSGRIVCSRRNTLARGTWYVDGGGGGGGDNRARGIMPHICTAAYPPATEVVLIVRGRTLYIPIFQAARHYLAQRNAALAVEPRLERPGQRSGSHDVFRHRIARRLSRRDRYGASSIWEIKLGARPSLLELAHNQLELTSVAQNWRSLCKESHLTCIARKVARSQGVVEAKLAKVALGSWDTLDRDADNVQSARSSEEARPAHALGLFELHVL